MAGLLTFKKNLEGCPERPGSNSEVNAKVDLFRRVHRSFAVDDGLLEEFPQREIEGEVAHVLEVWVHRSSSGCRRWMAAHIFSAMSQLQRIRNTYGLSRKSA